MVSDDIRKMIENACEACGFSPAEILLSHPESLAHGDYATNIALTLAKEAGKSPRVLAEEIVAYIKNKKPAEVVGIEVAGAGFINFHLSREFFALRVREILHQRDTWGSSDLLKGKRVMVEYTQPNPFKPFHIGHLMSNTLGESLSRIIQNAGATVARANYQGDVGLHTAKALYGMRMLSTLPEDIEGIGRAYAFGHEKYETDEVAKAEIIALNKKVYARDPEILEMYTRGRAASLAHFEELYTFLGTTFDYYFFESDTTPLGREAVREGLSRGIFEESEGAVIFRGETRGLHTRVFITKEGNPTYEAKELGLATLKERTWPFDESITTTAVEQAEYFKVVFSALKEMSPALGAKMHHVSHGMMQLREGKMSSRKGNVITGESLLEEMRVRAYEKMKDRDFNEEDRERVARAVAVGAIRYEVLKQKMGKNIIFDPERSLSFEGDSGPYLEYTHTRAVSVLEKAREAGVAPSVARPPLEAAPLERLLYRFPEIALRALHEYEPHHITTYLTELASAFNRAYATERILGSEDAPYKLALTEAFAITMKRGLWLLGIDAPEKM